MRPPCDFRFERMGLQEPPPGAGQALSSPWGGDAAPTPVHPMWPNPSLEMARAEPFTPLGSSTAITTEASPLVKAQIGRNRWESAIGTSLCNSLALDSELDSMHCGNSHHLMVYRGMSWTTILSNGMLR